MDYQIRKRTNQAGNTRHSVVLEVWADGQRKVVSGGTFDTDREAIRAGEKLLMQYEDDAAKLKVLQGNRTLSDWAKEWLDGLSTKQSTINAYRWRMENWVLPFLGEHQLKNLSVQVVDRWLNGTDLSHLSKRSKQSALDALRGCLKKAVQLGMVTTNVGQTVTLELTKAQKKAEKNAKRVKTWNYEEVDRILESAIGLSVEPLVVLGLLAGLRPGEAMVVRWLDIDWLNGTVNVSRTQSRTEDYQSIIVDSTKTGEVRQARLTSDAVLRLMRIKESQGDVDENQPIYVNHASSSATVWKQVQSLCKRAMVNILSPHCLRHTHASLLLENGATLAAVAKQLGHSNPTVTASVYWHLVNDQDDTISGIMDRALGKSVPSSNLNLMEV